MSLLLGTFQTFPLCRARPLGILHLLTAEVLQEGRGWCKWGVWVCGCKKHPLTEKRFISEEGGVNRTRTKHSFYHPLPPWSRALPPSRLRAAPRQEEEEEEEGAGLPPASPSQQFPALSRAPHTLQPLFLPPRSCPWPDPDSRALFPQPRLAPPPPKPPPRPGPSAPSPAALSPRH